MTKMIGVITSDLADPYQAAIWRGVEFEAERDGLGLMTFVGGVPGSPIPSEATSNIAYRVAAKENVDGLIAVVSTLTTYQNSDAVRAMLTSKRGLPWISVGAKIGAAPSVSVNGRSALHKLVVHLIRDHGRRRIAMVTGPDTHPEVRERYEAVENALTEEGVGLDPRLVVKGDFLPASGRAAVSSLLQNNADFDALVCMNDRMAIKAIEALREAGWRVPEDVSVVGFDGIPEGESLDFPLTTVAQPLFSLGREAVDVMRTMLDSRPVSDRKLECGLLIKETCGCAPIPFDGWKDQRSADVRRPVEIKNIDWLLQLACMGEFEAFGRALNTAVTQEVTAKADPEWWNRLLRYIRSECHTPQFEEIYEFGRSIVWKACTQLQVAHRIAIEHRAQTMQRISTSLAGSFELGKLLDRLRTGLNKLQIGQGYLALYPPGSRSTSVATLTMCPDNSVSADSCACPFRSSQIVPHNAGPEWRQLRWVFLPLVFEDEALGYMLLPGGVKEPSIYSSIKDQVSSSLKGALLLEQVQTHEQKLEREVALRTKEIRAMNSNLKAEIERRAALEQEVVDVSNRTMERIGQELHDDLSQQLAGVAVVASLTQERLSRARHPEAAALDRIGSLLRDLVLKTKQIARGLIATGLEARGLPSAIESLIDSVRKNYRVAVEFRSAPEFSLDDPVRALQVYRIVQEALLNAVRHSGSDVISVQLCSEYEGSPTHSRRQVLSVEVSDHGRGNPTEFVADGLGLRIMRYRAQMVGGLLSLVPNNPGTRVVCRFAREGGSMR